jgi:hypothetical protein
MTNVFVPCKGKTACQENETHCLTCGRSLEEVYGTRLLVDNIAEFAHNIGYQNSDAFIEYIASKVVKKLAYLQKKTVLKPSITHEYH